MVSGNKVKISSIKTFKLLDSFESFQESIVKKQYTCSGIQSWVQRIQFCDNDTEITMDLFGSTENTNVLRVSEKIFSKSEIEKMVDIFDLKLRNKYQIDAGIPIDDETRLASIGLKKWKNYYHCVIFNLDIGDSRKDSILYIHGIWKVILPEYIKNKLPR